MAVEGREEPLGSIVALVPAVDVDCAVVAGEIVVLSATEVGGNLEMLFSGLDPTVAFHGYAEAG